MLKQKRIVGRVKAVSLEDRTVEAWVSTVDVDRDGEIVEPKAFAARIDTFKSNPLFLWMHNPFAAPLGKVLELDIQDAQIGALIQFRESAEKVGTEGPSPNEALKMYADGTLTSFSIGFRVHEYKSSVRNEDGTRTPPRIVQAELYEVSSVTVPANTNARVKVAGVVLEDPIAKLLDVRQVVERVHDARARGEQVDEEIAKALQDLRCLMLFGAGKSPAPRTFDQQELKAALAVWQKLA